MKFKKSMLILILAVFIISIAGVCASDVNDTQMASQENAAIESTDENLITVEDIEPAASTAENVEIVSAGDDEIVGVENDLDELSANSAKFSDLVREIGDGGNIKLQHDYYTYDSGLVWIKQSNSVIDGNGAIIDMAGTNNFAFYVDYAAFGTTIKNLTIKNSGDLEGSGIYAWSSCTIENCSFINNQAWNNGGAVFFRLSGKVINCYFESNRVTGSNGTGGAVYFGGSGEVINCSFNGNRADGSGAVYIAGNGSVINCNFKDNSALDGGAVCISSIGTVKNCNFTNNTVNSTGGAVFILTRGTVENCNFVNNTAGEYGGAVQMASGTVKNCNFTNNTANSGGAVYIYPADGTVENCNFYDNFASEGGAVKIGLGTVKNCNFTNNSAGGYGGAIYLLNSNNVTNCNFTSNQASSCGAVFILNGELTNCNFVNNTASDNGGAVVIYDDGVVTYCNFVNNTVGDYGGALFIENGNVTNCNFTNNSASNSDGGAVVINYDGNVTNCNFVNNAAAGYGGAITVYESGNVTNCNFVDNTAGEYGGALLIFENGNVTNCNFTNNSAESNGGAVYIYGESNVTNCNFVNNHADNRAGGILINEGVVLNCNFTNNTGLYGAAIYAFDGFNVENCNFVNNIVDKAGGAILIYYIGTVENCNFTNNSADVGGAVMFYDNSEMTNCNFNNNSASSGGAVYFLEGGKLTNSNFTNNFAGLNGGAVYIKEDGIVENCNFNGNNASGGGAIRILENSTVKNSNFNDNYASVGGAIFINDDGVVSGCIFVNNSANNGTIYYNNTEYGSNLTISDNIFLNNEGVAIYFVKQDSTSNVDYNWFGNNATNYDIEPINTNVEINAWLFLNATANPDAISILDSSDIIFKLYAYTPSGVSEYDNSRLKAVNLTLTPTNGRVNTTKTELGEHVQYTAEVGRMGKLTASIENASYTISLLISDGTTFYDLNRTINGNDNDTIVLDRDYTYNSTFDYNLNNGIVINRPVTIIGNGHTLNASGLARIFNIQADNVVIENITFTNAEAEHYGGAICWSGVNGNLSGCNFANNSVTYDGGAIFWNVTGGGSISDCSFVDNSAVEGGALFLNAGAGTLVSECSFMNNTANHGGAIFCDSCVGDVVSGCSFVNNTASVGGAICWWSSNEGLVSGCSFVNNFARYYGTAIFVNNATDGVVSGCIFVNNSADKGTIYFDNEEYGSNLTINDNIFLNNDGVAIYFVNSDSTSNADFNWFGNNATNYDIAPITHNIEIGTWLFLNATANPDKIPIFDSSEIMFKLYAYTHSGVSEYDNSHLNAVNLTLTSTNGRVNTARTELGETVYYTAESAGIGKLTAEIENASHTISLPISDGTTFLDLNHVINGNDNDTVVLDRDYTYNPTFDYDLNDGIVIDRPVTIIGNGHIIDATGLARIFNVQADNVTIENITFTNAKAQRAGGAIYWTGANGNVSDCDFVNNSANYAAAIWWDGAYGVVSDCDFVNNSAYAVGAIWWYAHDGALSGCSFVNNSAESSGGAISWNGANSNVSDCIFVNNTADSAGAIDWNNQYGIVSGCSFVNNSANNAGAIRWTTNYGVVSGCSFVNNSAADGIIYFGNKYYGSNLSINDNIFLNNDGVAIYFEEIDSTSNADYNWFGNNATNHDMEPVTHNVEIGTWLFLNATADPVSISVSESSDILFKLYSYDSTGVADYDDSKLPVVNLTLTTNNGVVNESSVVLGDSVEFTYNGGGDASVTAAIENAEYTIVLDVAKTDTILLVDDLNMSYKDGSKLVVRLLDGDNNPISNALIYVNNTVVIYKYRTDADGVANVPVNLKPNKYTYNIIYEGDADYNAANATRTVVVNKLNVTLDATDFVVGYKDGSNFTATLTDADGNGISNVTVKFDNGVNAYRYRTDDNGVARAPIKLKPGTYTYVISFAGNGVYAPANITKTLTVEKATPKLEASNVTVEYKNGNLTARLTDADGNAIVGATIRFDNGINSYRYRTDDNGVATAPVNLKPGQYNYTISFEENSLYGSVNTTASVKVNKVDTVLTADNISMTFKDGTNYTARLADANGNAIAGVIVKVNNTVATYKYKTDADGYIHAPINLRLGEYAFTAFIEDSDIYNPCNVTSTVVITR